MATLEAPQAEVHGVVPVEVVPMVKNNLEVYPEVCQGQAALSILVRANQTTVLNGQTIIEVLECFAKQKL
jgi:hypothetical protein